MSERCGSYPFLWLAKDRGVPYSEVLMLADRIIRVGPGYLMHGTLLYPDQDLCKAVMDVFIAEKERQSEVIRKEEEKKKCMT